MDYFEAIDKLEHGKTVITSLVTGRVVREPELGHIWSGKHYASHTNIGLTKAEIGGLWSVTETNKKGDV